jgi:hypothetical protein
MEGDDGHMLASVRQSSLGGHRTADVHADVHGVATCGRTPDAGAADHAVGGWKARVQAAARSWGLQLFADVLGVRGLDHAVDGALVAVDIAEQHF